MRIDISVCLGVRLSQVNMRLELRVAGKLC